MCLCSLSIFHSFHLILEKKFSLPPSPFLFMEHMLRNTQNKKKDCSHFDFFLEKNKCFYWMGNDGGATKNIYYWGTAHMNIKIMRFFCEWPFYYIFLEKGKVKKEIIDICGFSINVTFFCLKVFSTRMQMVTSNCLSILLFSIKLLLFNGFR